MGDSSSGGDFSPQRRHRGSTDCPCQSKSRRNFAIDAITVEAQKLGLNILAHLGDMQAAFPMTVVAVNRSFLQKKRGLVKQFMADYSEAIYRLMQSKETGINIFKKHLKQQDTKILQATYDDIAGKFSFPRA